MSSPFQLADHPLVIVVILNATYVTILHVELAIPSNGIRTIRNSVCVVVHSNKWQNDIIKREANAEEKQERQEQERRSRGLIFYLNVIDAKACVIVSTRPLILKKHKINRTNIFPFVLCVSMCFVRKIMHV